MLSYKSYYYIIVPCVRDYDLVVTTYQTLGSDYGSGSRANIPDSSDAAGQEGGAGGGGGGKKGGKKQAGKRVQGDPLSEIHWHRIVFDEGGREEAGGGRMYG